MTETAPSGPSLPPKAHFADNAHAPRNSMQYFTHAQSPLQSSSAPNLGTAPPGAASAPPKAQGSYSNKWIAALKAKPTLSRTWEKKSFVEEQMGLPATAAGDLESGARQQMQILSPRPTSLYASPAAIAAFRALPSHSAPPTPTNAAQQV